MIIAFGGRAHGEGRHARGRMAGRLVAAATVLGWTVIVALVAASYVGRSTSPYGTCYASSGRSVPCALVRH
jgi:hypothetical protein